LALATFVSTSIDNLLLLVGFLTSPGFRARSVIVGYLTSMITVLGIGIAASYVADFAPNRYAGYLGLLPIAMGVTQLYKVVRLGGAQEAVRQPVAQSAVAVCLTMLANSGDSLAAFVALFAETREPFTFIIVGVVAALSLTWVVLARWITGHAALQRLLRRWGRYLLPAILISVGAYILADTRTDTLEVAAAQSVEEIGQTAHR
jgi:cadmium resistance protein CadD (predicted permease)